jgi:carbamoyl-phosphate synthase large subunit
VEHAGVHSGDATLVLPSFSLSKTAIRQIKSTSQKIAKSLAVSGPFNIQFLVNENGEGVEVLVIEANLRASRSFPFVSKVLGVDFIELAAKIMLGEKVKVPKVKKPKYFGVKVPHFSFIRLRQADPVLRVEMASTGEVACFGDDLYEAYLKALLSTGISLPQKAVLLSLGGDESKERLLPAAKILQKLGFNLYATEHTCRFLKEHGIPAQFVYKVHDNKRPNVVDVIRERKVDLVINLSDRSDLAVKHLVKETTDGYLIRRAAIDVNIPLFTKASIAHLFVTAIAKHSLSMLKIKSWDEYVGKIK